MPTNNDIKEKIYQETLNQLAKSIPSYTNDDALATTWEDANTELYVIEVEDIEKALHFAIDKTEAEARSDTARQILADVKTFAFTIKFEREMDADEQMQFSDYMNQMFEQHASFIETLKKKYKVD